MKNTNFKQFAITFLTACAVIFGLTTLANAAVKPELISKSANGDYANANSQFFNISADGRYVVFQSGATNLVSGITDTNNNSDIFLRDTQTGTVRCLSCVSAANPTSTANNGSFNPIISPDGRYVVFASLATDLVGGSDTNNTLDIFRFDTQLNQRVLVSVVPFGSATGNGASGFDTLGSGYNMSDNGRYIVFASVASNLTNSNDPNGKSDIFLRDMETNSTRTITLNNLGDTGNNDSFDPTISADGQYIAFTSQASDFLPPGVDANSFYDVFIYDAQAQQIRCASMSTRTDDVRTGNNGSYSASISKDGNRVAYFTDALDVTNIQIPFGNPNTNIVVHDIGFRQNTLVTVNVAGNAGANGQSGTGSFFGKNVNISANGRYVTFDSNATNLSPLTGGNGSNYNVFRRDLTRGITEIVSLTPAGTPSMGNSFLNREQRRNSMSRDGRFITFYNFGNGLTAENFPTAGNQVYVRDMLNGITTALSLNNAGTGLGNGDLTSGSQSSLISANGKAVVFTSNSTDLTSPPTSNQFLNLFKSKVPTPQSAVSDFDGDGKTDYAVWRPSTGYWYVLPNTRRYVASTVAWGTNGDQSVPADYSGDGQTDYAVFRPSNGTWYIFDSANFNSQTIQFGQSGDQPVPADYDGDGKTDIAVYRPSNGTWYVLNSSNNVVQFITFGLSNDKTVPGDYDGDGKTDIAVYRDGVWYVLKSTTNQITIFNYGLAGDRVVPADYDGDGKTDAAVFRGGVFYILGSRDGNSQAINWGVATDLPAVGDFDGDGKADVTIFRPDTGDWWSILSATGNVKTFYWGQNGDAPAPSAFVR